MADDWMLEYVGKGYRQDATGPEKWGCWELCVEIKQRQGVRIPSSLFGWRRILRRLQSGEAPRKFDIVLFSDPETKIVVHAGTMFNEVDMLHSAPEFGGVVLDRLSRYPKHVRAIVRHDP